MRVRYRWANVILQVALFVAALCLYTLTLNPDVQPADSGEFQIAAIALGIPHPPGYPLYTMLGWLFAQAPFGAPFARVTFLSAVASAATLVLVSLSIQSLGKGSSSNWMQVAAGLVAATALGTSTTFWAQATTTNIRSLTAFFTAAMVYALARIFANAATIGAQKTADNLDSPGSLLCLFALALGLGVGHHVSLVFTGAIFAVYVIVSSRRAKLDWRIFALGALVLLATQLVWLYLPIRDAAGARFAPGNLNTLSGLAYHIFARGFAGDMLAFAAPEYLIDRLSILPTLLQFEFSPLVLILALLSGVALIWKRRTIGLALLGAFLLHLFITITYRAPQTVEYALPAWVLLAVIVGAGLVILADALNNLVRTLTAHAAARIAVWAPAFVSLILVVVVGAILVRDGVSRLPSFIELAADRSTRVGAQAVLVQAAANGVVLAQWHQATPMWALQDVEGLRPDIDVEYVYPHGAQPYADTFADQALESAKSHTTYLTSYYATSFAARQLSTVPVNQAMAWQVISSTTHLDRLQAGDGMLLFDGRLQVLPLQIALDHVETGQVLQVIINWRRVGQINENESLTVRIMRNDGRLAANADIRVDTVLPQNQWQSQRLALGIPLDLTPGAYSILVGMYRSEPAGFVALKERGGGEYAQAATVTISPASLPAVTMHPMAQPPGNTPSLIGVDYDTGIPGRLRVLTHWELATISATYMMQDSTGREMAATQSIPTVAGAGRYFTLIFDVSPTKDLRLAQASSGLSEALPDYDAGERYIPFADQMVLIGSSTSRQGNQLKTDLQWLSARPIMTDYIISVRVAGDGFQAAHDGVPVLGALPTLKWMRGSQITDRHSLELGAYRGSLAGAVLVYDSSTEQPLPALDERYERGITFEVVSP
jgi:Protein of unknown function (DUF2723)